jgi:hypothetical protein
MHVLTAQNDIGTYYINNSDETEHMFVITGEYFRR